MRRQDETLQLWLAEDAEYAHLEETEIFWRNVQPFLAARGYALRPRYHPDWVPSWRISGRSPAECEDHVEILTLGRVMDALRLKDGKRVALKKVRKDADGRSEVAIMQYFSTEPQRSDPRNRCVPLLDVLDPGENSRFFMIVIPLLQRLDEPPFLSAGEVMEFCGQLLEGLAFMHEHNVEHRDCCRGNIMMEGEILYPKGSHPIYTQLGPVWEDPMFTKPLRRSDVPIKYYFIDFGHSVQFDSFEVRKPLATLRGQDKTAPELSSGEPVDGFKLDVYCVGNLFHDLIDQFPQLAVILLPLVGAMRDPLPEKRPAAADASVWFDRIRSGLSSRGLTARLRWADETLVQRVYYGTTFYAGNLKRLLWRNQAALAAKYRKYSHLPYLMPSSYESSSDLSDSTTVVSMDPQKSDGPAFIG